MCFQTGYQLFKILVYKVLISEKEKKIFTDDLRGNLLVHHADPGRSGSAIFVHIVSMACLTVFLDVNLSLPENCTFSPHIYKA